MSAVARSRRQLEPPADFTRLTRALRHGQLVDDRIFDEVFPARHRRASALYWTPVDAAFRAGLLLAARPNAKILDVGAGIGKLCLVIAAALPRLRVRGIEQRAHFVDVARKAAAKMEVEVDFVHGTIEDEDAADIDGIYLFNPFAENLTAAEDHLDETVELSEEKFWRDIASMERLLQAARPGTRVVTYCGWGGEMPPDYHLTRREQCCGTMELWVKAEASATG